MKHRKIIALLLSLVLITSLLAACGGTTASSSETSPANEVSVAESGSSTPKEQETKADKDMYIAVVSKAFQHQFWQIVKQGAEDAAKEYGVTMTFDGPSSEVAVNEQIDILNNVILKKPDAIALAAMDAESVLTQMNETKSQGIPVIGFDSGVPNAPEGSIYSTISTDSYAAASLAADKMFENEDFKAKVEAATADAPVVIACQNQEAISAAANLRTFGFLDRMKELCEEVQPGAVEIIGHETFVKQSEKPAAVTLVAVIPPSASYTDNQMIAQNIFQNNPNLIGYMGCNEGSVTGILAATNDGTDLDREKGLYKNVLVVGFDAGQVQKNAIRSGYFYGSITQDPYKIGHLTVETAIQAAKGEPVENVIDTGCYFYTADNMDSNEIAHLLYD